MHFVAEIRGDGQPPMTVEGGIAIVSLDGTPPFSHSISLVAAAPLMDITRRRYTFQISVEDLEDSKHIIDVQIPGAINSLDIDGLGQYFWEWFVDHALVKPRSWVAHSSGDWDGRVPTLAFMSPSDPNLEYLGDWEDIAGGDGAVQGMRTKEVGSTVQFSFRGELPCRISLVIDREHKLQLTRTPSPVAGSRAYIIGTSDRGDGELSIAYHLDGNRPIPRNYPSSHISDVYQRMLYDIDYGNDGVHTLKAELVNVQGLRSFVITGVLYDWGYLERVDELPDIPLNSTVLVPTPDQPSTTLDPSPTTVLKPAILASIIAGSIAGFLLVVVAVFCMLRIRRRKRSAAGWVEAHQVMAVPYEKSYHAGPFSQPHIDPNKSYASIGDHATNTTTFSIPVATTSALHGLRTQEQDAANSAPLHEAAGNNSVLFNAFMNMLNTHYESINQPPAYPASMRSPGVAGSQR